MFLVPEANTKKTEADYIDIYMRVSLRDRVRYVNEMALWMATTLDTLGRDLGHNFVH